MNFIKIWISFGWPVGKDYYNIIDCFTTVIRIWNCTSSGTRALARVPERVQFQSRIIVVKQTIIILLPDHNLYITFLTYKNRFSLKDYKCQHDGYNVNTADIKSNCPLKGKQTWKRLQSRVIIHCNALRASLTFILRCTVWLLLP